MRKVDIACFLLDENALGTLDIMLACIVSAYHMIIGTLTATVQRVLQPSVTGGIAERRLLLAKVVDLL